MEIYLSEADMYRAERDQLVRELATAKNITLDIETLAVWWKAMAEELRDALHQAHGYREIDSFIDLCESTDICPDCDAIRTMIAALSRFDAGPPEEE